MTENPRSVAIIAEKSAGFTASGSLKVLCAFIPGAVRTRPDNFFAFAPCNSHATSAGRFGSRLQNVA